MFVIVVNSSNIVQDGQNNKFVYNFPNSITIKDKFIAVSRISIYYSWFNITSLMNNNKISYNWNGVNYDLIIPDGLYQITNLNQFLQFEMIKNGTYLINNIGENVYYLEIMLNPTRYAVQINSYNFPVSLPSGYSTPSNFPGFPTQTFNPTIIIPQYFNQIIGYPINFTSNSNINNAYVPPSPSIDNNYVSKLPDGTLSYLSSIAPNVQPNSSVFVSMSNINNPYSQPSSIIYSITPSNNVSVGEIIDISPPNFMWTKMIDGTYNNLTLQLLGIDNRPIKMNDKETMIMLTIRDANEGFLGTK